MKKSGHLSLSDLIKKGNILYDSLGHGRIFISVVNYKIIYDSEFQISYKKWVEEVIKSISSYSARNNSILFDSIYIDSLLTQEYFDKNESLEKAEGKRAYNLFLDLFKRQIDFLRELTVKGKVILKINKKNKTITVDSRICPFRGGQGKNKRFEYIIKLAQGGKIGGSKLSDTSLQNISTEIGKINKRLIKTLDLTHNVIKNDDNSGYEIDRSFYEFVFV